MSDDPQGEVERDSIADKLRVILQSAANNTVCVLDGHKLLAEFSKPEIAAMRKALSEPPQAALRPSAGAGEIEALLLELEEACDEVAGTRSRETYLRMIDVDRADAALERLEDARRAAREYLASDAASLTAPAPGVQTEALRAIMEETVIAGYPAGDSAQTLANVRAMRAENLRHNLAVLRSEPAPGVREAMEECAKIADEHLSCGCSDEVCTHDLSFTTPAHIARKIRARLSSLPAGKTRGTE